MTLVLNDFKQVILFPKAVFIGLIGQILMLPIIGFVLIKLLQVDTMIAVGVMIIAACPGGSSSNLISHLAKGDTALSITLTAISSLITVISIPLVIGFSLAYFLAAEQMIQLPIINTIITLIVITLLPVSIGMLIKHKFSQFAAQQERWINIFSGSFLALLVVTMLVQQAEAVKQGFIDIGLIVLGLNIISMTTGFLVSKVVSLNQQQTTTITIEIGIQNGTLAILIATTILHQPEFAIPAAIYSLIMFGTGSVLVYLRRRSSSVL